MKVVNDLNDRQRNYNFCSTVIFRCDTRKLFDISGSVITALSVVPPGLFALLLTDLMLLEMSKDIHPVPRVIVDLVFCSTAMAGKYGLMRAYNTESFKSLADFKFSELIDLQSWTIGNFVNYIFSIIGGAVFTELAWLSLIQTADLARDYNSSLGNGIASALDSPYIYIPVLIANMASNILCFPNMHRISFLILKLFLMSSFSPLSEQAIYLNKKIILNSEIQPVVEYFNLLISEYRKEIELQSIDKLNNLYGNIFNELIRIFEENIMDFHGNYKEKLGQLLIVIKTKDLDPIKENLIVLKSETNTSNNFLLFLAKLATIIALSLTAICIVGLSNFWSISQFMAKMIHINPVAPLISTMDMLSMSALAFISTICYKETLLSILYPAFKKSSIEILGFQKQYAINIFSLIICILGGMPNAYQALKLANQSIAIVVIAGFTSFIIEIAGFKSLTQSHFEKSELEKLKKINKDEDIIPELFTLVKGLTQLEVTQPKFSMQCVLFKKHDSSLTTPLLLSYNN